MQLGPRTVVFETTGRNLDAHNSRIAPDTGMIRSEHHVGRPLLTLDEVRNLPQDEQLLFLAGLRPIVANKPRYPASGLAVKAGKNYSY